MKRRVESSLVEGRAKCGKSFDCPFYNTFPTLKKETKRKYKTKSNNFYLPKTQK
jgi:hypothetical protein